MSINNYGELKAKLSRYLFNQRFLADYDDYTSMFEADANSRLRVLPMEAIDTMVTYSGSSRLPLDYLAWRAVLWGRGEVYSPPAAPAPPFQNAVELDYVHPAYLRDIRVDRGNPRVFTIEGDQFRSRVVTTSTPDIYEFHYYQKIPTLVGNDSNTNWLLTEYPNAYLFGLIVEAAGQGRNAEMAQLYKARRDEVFAEITQRYAMTTGATSSSVRTAEYF
jgi:hypothetical protein